MPLDVATIAALANIVVTIFGGFIFLLNVQKRQAMQGVMITNLSRQVDRLESTLEGLRRGNGWMQQPERKYVDGEY